MTLLNTINSVLRGESLNESKDAGFVVDAGELILFAQNHEPLYNQFNSIIKNLLLKMLNGKYDSKLAAKLWQYWTDAAAKEYVKEIPGTPVIPVSVRKAAAERLEKDEVGIIRGTIMGDNEDYSHHLPTSKEGKKKIAVLRGK